MFVRTDDEVVRRQFEFAGTEKIRLPRARVSQWVRAIVLAFVLSGVFAAVFFAVLTVLGWALPFAVVGSLFLGPPTAAVSAWRLVRFVGVYDTPHRPLRWLVDAYLADAELPDAPDDEPATLTTHVPVFDDTLPTYRTAWSYRHEDPRPETTLAPRATRVPIPASRILYRWR